MDTIDLFSGCGGMSLGFQVAGFNILAAVENWGPARKVYEDNFSHPVYDIDLNNVDEAIHKLIIYSPAIIIGGPPCQDFSMAGVRIEGARALLTYNFAKIISELKPKWFVFENVPGAKKSKTWENSKKILEKTGYGITEITLNSAFYGVPQNRKRFFAIGRLGEIDNFLKNDLESSASSKKMTLREYAGEKFDIEFYYRHPRNWGRKGIFSLDEPAPTVRATVRDIPPGYTAHLDDAGPISEARALNIRERALVQTFPDTFTFSGSRTAQNTMIANAVPIELANHIAKCVINHEIKLKHEKFDLFRYWLAKNYNYKEKTISSIIYRISQIKNISTEISIEERIKKIKDDQSFKKLSPNDKSKITKALKHKLNFEMSI